MTGAPIPTALRPDHFDGVLTGRTDRLVRDDGVVLPMELARWRSTADGDDDRVLDRCTGPVVDLGCGPGRLVTALARRGVPALGVDSSPVARTLCRRRGAPMVCRDVFAPLPGEGAWSHVLLVDGNIGIGGDPLRLLARARALLAAGGTVLVETGAVAGEWWRGTARAGRDGTPLPWACVGSDALRARAGVAGLRVVAEVVGDRSFVELVAV